MEPFFLTCMVVAFFLTKGKVDTAAYSNGKEPPGVVRARMKHESGGGARTPSGRPTGRGALGLMLASRWANACQAAQQRADHRAARRRAWYDETAPRKDAAWRDRQQRKLERSDWARERWAQARGLFTGTSTGTGPAPWESGRHTNTAQPDRDPNTTEPSDKNVDASPTEDHTPDTPTDPPGEGDDTQPGQEPDKVAREPRTESGPVVTESGPVARTPEPDAETGPAIPEPASPVANPLPDSRPAPTNGATHRSSIAPPTQGSTTVYEQAVQKLIHAADQVNEFHGNVSALADRLAGDGWGTEATGPLADSLPALDAWEGVYRDTAAAMKAQGDQGAAAYEQAPYVPGAHAVLG